MQQLEELQQRQPDADAVDGTAEHGIAAPMLTSGGEPTHDAQHDGNGGGEEEKRPKPSALPLIPDGPAVSKRSGSGAAGGGCAR